ncbi:MAG: sortase [Anaerolineae bacterium]|nr:sortase [Anaerolineae bacterium]
MRKHVPALSRALLILGVLMILTGIGWGVRQWVNRPPEPEFTDAGAVVLAVTALVERASATPTDTPPPTHTPTAFPTPTRTPPQAPIDSTGGPPPTQAPPTLALPTRALPTATPSPTSTSTPTLTPRPTVPPAANPPTRIVAEPIGLDAKVTTMTWQMVDREGTFLSEWIVPKDAAGWHVNSALPGHGENVVLSGHHNVDGKVFRYVVDLEPGDRVTVYADGQPYDYWVTEKYILKETGVPLAARKKNAQWILPTGDHRLTLVTCWPYEWPGNSHRVIVVARPAEYFWALGLDVDTGDRGTLR